MGREVKLQQQIRIERRSVSTAGVGNRREGFRRCACVGVGSMQLPYKLDLGGVDEVD